ncbi:hypothetical protein CR513_59977, partial [Mucuna pruriens]
FKIASFVYHLPSIFKHVNLYKTNFEKAYDRVDWGFLCFTLFESGFSLPIINLIMNCTSALTLSQNGTMRFLTISLLLGDIFLGTLCVPIFVDSREGLRESVIACDNFQIKALSITPLICTRFFVVYQGNNILS